MKLKILTFILAAFATFSVSAQGAVVVEIDNKKGESYWLEIADRNVGASSNRINSYGEYFAWNTDSSIKARKVMGEKENEVGYGVKKFNTDGKGEWRLPNRKELQAILSRIVHMNGSAAIYNERGDKTKFTYLPYAGKKGNGGAIEGLGALGIYWTSEGLKSSKYAIALEISKDLANNPLIFKTDFASIRCVRVVK